MMLRSILLTSVSKRTCEKKKSNKGEHLTLFFLYIKIIAEIERCLDVAVLEKSGSVKIVEGRTLPGGPVLQEFIAVILVLHHPSIHAVVPRVLQQQPKCSGS